MRRCERFCCGALSGVFAVTALLLLTPGNAYGIDDLEFPVKKVEDLGKFLDGWRAAPRYLRQNFVDSLQRLDSDSAAAGQYDLLARIGSCDGISLEEVSMRAQLERLGMGQAVASLAYACAQEAIRRDALGDAREFLLIARDRKSNLAFATFRNGRWDSELVGEATAREYAKLRMSALHFQFVASLAGLTASRAQKNGSAILFALLLAFLTLRIGQFPLLMQSYAHGDRLRLPLHLVVELSALWLAALNAPDWDFLFGDWEEAVASWFLRLLQVFVTMLYVFLLYRLITLHIDKNYSATGSLALWSRLVVVSVFASSVIVPVFINSRGARSSAPLTTAFFSTGALAMLITGQVGRRLAARAEPARPSAPVEKHPHPDPRPLNPAPKVPYSGVYAGRVSVRDRFQVVGGGVAAGCMVLEGSITRDSQVQIFRQGIEIYTGRVSSLRRFKTDVSEAIAGLECGVTLRNFVDFKQGDVINVCRERATAPGMSVSALL